MDAIVFFDDGLVPWDRVFLVGDVELCNQMPGATNRNLHSGHQAVTKPASSDLLRVVNRTDEFIQLQQQFMRS